jgi:hypothetical protein
MYCTGGGRIRIRSRRSRVERMGFEYSLYSVFRVWCFFRVWDLSIPCSVMCECSLSLLLLLLSDLVFGDLVGSSDSWFSDWLLFSCDYLLLGFARMDASKDRLVRNITIAATALCAALLLTADYGPQPHALTPVFATPLCVSVEYYGTSFSLWNCVPRFAESLPVSGVLWGCFQDYLLNRGLLDSLSLSLSVEYSGRSFCPLELYF